MHEVLQIIFYRAKFFFGGATIVRFLCGVWLCLQENVTVLDIINRDLGRPLDETVANDVSEWPFSTVEALDSDEFLLCEVQAYLKHK